MKYAVLPGLIALAALACPAPAAAHAILVESTPAVHAKIAAGPLTMVLRFNSRIDAARSKLTLTGGVYGKDGERLVLSPNPAEDRLTAKTDLAAGDFVLRWQVLAIDGHLTRGIVPFSVTATPAPHTP
jgi:methionine-rich copper-binding protein CopC